MAIEQHKNEAPIEEEDKIDSELKELQKELRLLQSKKDEIERDDVLNIIRKIKEYAETKFRSDEWRERKGDRIVVQDLFMKAMEFLKEFDRRAREAVQEALKPKEE